MFKIKEHKKKIVEIIAGVLFIVFVCCIYNQWNDMFYEFGRNLYHLFN